MVYHSISASNALKELRNSPLTVLSKVFTSCNVVHFLSQMKTFSGHPDLVN